MIYDEKIWLKHYDQGVPATVKYPKVPLFTFLEESASKYPQNRALSYLGNNISYLKLDRLVNKAANALTGLGVQKGDRVALYLANTPQFIIMLYGILKIGAIAVESFLSGYPTDQKGDRCYKRHCYQCQRLLPLLHQDPLYAFQRERG